MRTGIRTLAAMALTVLLSAATTLQAQEMPDPAAEAALYEMAKSEGSLVWYSGGALDTTKAMATAFQKKYPGVQVEVLRLPGASQYQRFMEEVAAGHDIADILWLSDHPSMVALVDDGMVAEWKIPTHDRFDPRYLMGQSAYAFNRVDSVIIYNENLVTEEEAALLQADWRNVLDPRFTSRFAVTSAKCGACYAPISLFLDPAQAKTYPEDFLEQVGAQKPAVYGDFIAMVDRVVAGEKDFAYWSFESIAATRRAQGAPVRWVYPQPTPAFPSTWMAISATAPHPAAARLFLNWMGSEDGALSLQRDYYSKPTLQGVEDSRSFVSEDWYQPPAELYEVDFENWPERYETDMARWVKAIQQ